MHKRNGRTARLARQKAAEARLVADIASMELNEKRYRHSAIEAKYEELKNLHWNMKNHK